MTNSKQIKRYMKSEYGPRKKQFPKSLDFLSTSGINFYAITEDESSSRITRTIEIKPTTLKRLVEENELLYDSLVNNNDTIKQLKSVIRKLQSDNRNLKDNKEKHLKTEIDIKQAKAKITALSKEIKSAKFAKSEIKEKEAEIDSLTLQVSSYEKTLRDLKAEKMNFKNEIDELKEKLDQQAEDLEKLEKVNSTLMKNIEDSPDIYIKRESNVFFSGDNANKINNNKPYPGGKPRKGK